MSSFDWDADPFDTEMGDATGGGGLGGSTFMARARAAAPDDDDHGMDGDGDGDRPRLPEENWDVPEQETALQALTRHWTNERHAPDILPAQDVLLAGLLDHIRRQTDTVALLRADPDTSEDEHFRIMLVQTEAERVRFVVRAYVRTRLSKIERLARWLVSTPDMHSRLSEAELGHAQRFATMLERHFGAAVLQGLPEAQRSLNDTTAFMPPMITEPNKAIAVFAHARKNCPPVYLPDGNTLEMKRGQITLTPYHVIEQLLLREEVDLV